MKNCLVFLMLLCSTITLYSQETSKISIYQSATEISKFAKESGMFEGATNLQIFNLDDEYIEILIYFSPELKKLKELDKEIGKKQIDSIYTTSGNPFICSTCVIETDFDRIAEAGAKKLYDSSVEGTQNVSSNGGISLGNLLDGAAKFLVGRVKKELAISVFEDLKKQLNKVNEMKVLFPDTEFKLQMIDKEIYNWNKYYQTLNTAFKNDLNVLPQSLSIYIDTTTKFTIPDLNRAVLSDGFQLAQAVMDSIAPIDIIRNLANQETSRIQKLEPSNYGNLQNSMKSLNLFSEAIIKYVENSEEGEAPSFKEQWIDLNDLKNLKDDLFGRNLFLGLLYQHIGSISFINKDGTSMSLREILKDGFNDLKIIEDLIIEAEKANNGLKAVRKNKGNPSPQDLYNFVDGTLGAVKWTKELLVNKAKIAEKLDQTQTQNFLDFAIESADLVNKIIFESRQKNYPTAVLLTSELLDLIVPEYYNKGNPSPKKIVDKYGMFIANLASAESSDEVVAALEATTLPPGSASIKKNAHFNLAFNAYVGPTYGLETLYRLNNKEENNEYFGLTTPIGLSLSTKFLGGALTVFGSAIDIGALTAFRFQDDTTENLPEFDLENVLAPGIHFIYSVPRYPISIGAGWQSGPNLRRLTQTMLDVLPEGFEGRRFGVFITVDIPLVNIINVKETKD